MAEEMREAAGEDEQVSDHCQVAYLGWVVERLLRVI
jgi:hypothetical protein